MRGNLQHPDVYSADLARLYTYGDWSRNLSLEENDIVFVPREISVTAWKPARRYFRSSRSPLLRSIPHSSSRHFSLVQ